MQEQPCPTCARIFVRPDIVVQDLPEHPNYYRVGREEHVLLDKDELRATAASCAWCNVQLNYIRKEYADMRVSEKEELCVRLEWEFDEGEPVESLWLSAYEFGCVGERSWFTSADNIVALRPGDHPIVTTNITDLPLSTSSSTHLDLTRSWWQDCLSNHSACRTPSDDRAWLPTRLVDVSTTPPRLILTKSLSPSSHSTPYIALSHRWSSSPSIFKLLSTNESSLLQQLPLDMLPAAFLDALDFTRRLGVRYIWIDSLCIQQDSVYDWTHEAGMMHKVYTCCSLNLAVDPITHSPEGMYQTRSPAARRSLLVHPKSLVRSGRTVPVLLTIQPNLAIDISRRRTLCTRGWVFQERLLSSRSIHFSDQIFWECRRSKASETFRCGHKSGGYAESLKDWIRAPTPKNWVRATKRYLGRELSFAEDRGMAIHAVGRAFEEAIRAKRANNSNSSSSIDGGHDDLDNDGNNSNTTSQSIESDPHTKANKYAFGLFTHSLPLNLIWQLDPINPHLPPPSRQKTYRAPTWSWESLDFTNRMLFHSCFESGDVMLALARVLRINLMTTESDFGGSGSEDASSAVIMHHRRRRAYLRLRARVQRVELSALGEYGYTLYDLEKQDMCGYTLDCGPGSAPTSATATAPASAADNDNDNSGIYLLPLVLEKDWDDVFALILAPRKNCGQDEDDKEEEKTNVYERIGVAIVAKGSCPAELRWVFEFARGVDEGEEVEGLGEVVLV